MVLGLQSAAFASTAGYSPQKSDSITHRDDSAIYDPANPGNPTLGTEQEPEDETYNPANPGNPELSQPEETKSYTLTLSVRDSVFTYQYNAGDSIIAPSVSKEGYTFMGWSPALPVVMPAKDVKCNATYEANYYPIEYLFEDGTLYRSYMWQYGTRTDSARIANLDLEGYNVTPWDYSDFPRYMVADTVKVYCSRNAAKYIVSFYMPYGGVVCDTLAFGDPIIVPEVIESEGYTFLGWSPEVAATMPDHDLQYKAMVETNTFTVNFVDYDNKLISSKEYYYGYNVRRPETPFREGYTFTGWSPEVRDTVLANATYTATYDMNSYNVLFMAEGDSVISFRMNYGAVISSEPKAPAIEGKTFAGWVPEFVKGVTIVPAEDIVFRARYIENPHTITYYVDGEVYYTGKLEAGDSINALAVPVKEGYTFSGWDNVPGSMPDADVEVRGTFAVNKHSVTFYIDEETIVKEFAFGEKIEAPLPEKEGCTFAGWNVDVQKTMPDFDLEYKAVFNNNKYTITFYDYDGVTVLRKLTLDFGAVINIPTDPSRLGYTFKCWNDVIVSKMPAHDLSYVAKYDLNTYKLTYMVDGVEILSVNNIFGREISILPEQTRNGFSFSGWTYTNPETGESASLPKTMPCHDVVISGSFTGKMTFEVDGLTFSITDFEKLLAEVVGVASSKPAPGKARRAAADENNITIPSEINVDGASYVVNRIAAKAFENVPVKTLTIPSTVEVIEPSAIVSETLENVVFEGETLPEMQANAIDLDNVAVQAPNASEDVIEEAMAQVRQATEEMAAQETSAKADDSEMVAQKFNVAVSADMAGVEVTGAGEYDYGQTIVVSAPHKEGYKTIFTVTAPSAEPIVLEGIDCYAANAMSDLNVAVSYSKQSYKITYIAGANVVSTVSVAYGESLADISVPEAAELEGFTFDGWSPRPATMPARDVTVIGTYSINKYKVTFVVDEEEFAVIELNYGAEISLPELSQSGYDFEWLDAVETVPSHDVVINGKFTKTGGGIADSIDRQAIAAKIAATFNASGVRVNTAKGLNIIRMNDGSVRKVMK